MLVDVSKDKVVGAVSVAMAIIAKGIADEDYVEKVRVVKGVSSRKIQEQRALVAIGALTYAATESEHLSKMCCKAALSRVGAAQC